MTSKEKAELLKKTIYQLYSKEGRSKSYISRLLEINRKTLSDKIKEWDFPEPEPVKHISPSTQKFINKNRMLIKSRLDNDVPVTKIAKELGVYRELIQNVAVSYDPVLKKAHDDYINRMHTSANNAKEQLMNKSCRNYHYDDIEGEIWKPILGYPEYEVSNMGRVRKYTTVYKKYYLLSQQPNKNNGRLYVALYKNKKCTNMQVARVVAHNFVEGYSETKNTVNHKDGNISNNTADNLEWVSQAENNLHSYRKLNRQSPKKRYIFKKLIYLDKYEFKTVAALAKFIGKSETQTRRYLDNPEKHNIKIIK